MCGITAIVNKYNGPVDKSLLRDMTRLIAHRGPDGEEFYYDDCFAFGHRRLKIVDPTEYAAQPMIRNGFVIIFNGEIYNFVNLRQQLIRAGHRFTTASDTEVILAAYMHWGNKCVDHFNGMWSFVIFDPYKQSLFCSRDRFGIKPFCYYETDKQFFIVSEIKQLLAIPGFIPKLDHAASYNFLYHSSINGLEQSFFKDVKFLPAGTNLIYDLRSRTCQLDQWYSLEKMEKFGTISYEEACSEFEKIFGSSVALQSNVDVPLGSALSGGLDSSSIVCMMKSKDKKGLPLHTISTCIEHGSYNEIHYINEISDHIAGNGNKIFPNISEIMSQRLMEKITYHQDQPIIGGSFFSEYKLYEKAGELGLKVMLSGQGADEYLAGYDYFNYLNIVSRLQKFDLVGMFKESKRINKLKGYSDYYLFKSITHSLLYSGYRDVRKSLFKPIQRPYFTRKWMADHRNLLNPYPEVSLKGKYDLAHLSKEAITSYSLPHQLHSEDRHSMMFSVESRLPFLDHRLVEFSLKLPDDFKMKGGVTKRVMRDSLKEILPAKIRNRYNKMGFPGPEDKLFESKCALITKDLQELSHHFPEIFSPSLSKIYDKGLESSSLDKGFMFRALSFYNWAKVFNVRN